MIKYYLFLIIALIFAYSCKNKKSSAVLGEWKSTTITGCKDDHILSKFFREIKIEINILNNGLEPLDTILINYGKVLAVTNINDTIILKGSNRTFNYTFTDSDTIREVLFFEKPFRNNFCEKWVKVAKLDIENIRIRKYSNDYEGNRPVFTDSKAVNVLKTNFEKKDHYIENYIDTIPLIY